MDFMFNMKAPLDSTISNIIKKGLGRKLSNASLSNKTIIVKEGNTLSYYKSATKLNKCQPTL